MNYTRYILAFIITVAIFATAFALSNTLNKKRFEQIQSIEDKMSIDILSLETQFDLLSDLSCKQIVNTSLLSPEIRELARKLSYMEEQRGSNDPTVIRLKKKYSLLQIKDILLMRKVSDKCFIAPTIVLYFYSNDGECSNCNRQGYVLTQLNSKYPQLRVYAFDADLDLSALRTLRKLHSVNKSLPALVIHGKTYYGFVSLEKLTELLPELITEDGATTTNTK
jgi:uncharacterized membrane protein